MLSPSNIKKFKRKFAKAIGLFFIFLGILFYIIDNIFQNEIIEKESFFSFSNSMILLGVALTLPDIINRIKNELK